MLLTREELVERSGVGCVHSVMAVVKTLLGNLASHGEVYHPCGVNQLRLVTQPAEGDLRSVVVHWWLLQWHMVVEYYLQLLQLVPLTSFFAGAQG